MEDKNLNIDSSTKEIIKKYSPMIPTSHPTSIRCEQKIIQESDTSLKINNYYMTMTDKQYIHFAKEMGKKFLEVGQYQSENKSIFEMVINKCVELSTEKYGDPLRNLTVAEVAKDLKMGENLANQLFKRPDFPSVNIGKTKTVCALAYNIWKMQHRESEVNANE